MENVILAAAISTMPAALHAQEATASDEDKAGEIVVTATAIAKLDVPLAETPQNITVITQDAFERQNATGVEEILRYVPSVQAELSGRSGFDAFLVRGFDQSRYQFRDGLRLDPGFLQQQEVGGLASVEYWRLPAPVMPTTMPGMRNSAMSGAIILSTPPARSSLMTKAEARDGAQVIAAIPPARTVLRDALKAGEARDNNSDTYVEAGSQKAANPM